MRWLHPPPARHGQSWPRCRPPAAHPAAAYHLRGIGRAVQGLQDAVILPCLLHRPTRETQAVRTVGAVRSLERDPDSLLEGSAAGGLEGGKAAGRTQAVNDGLGLRTLLQLVSVLHACLVRSLASGAEGDWRRARSV